MRKIAALAYFAAGGALLTSIGRSRVTWDDPPTLGKRLVTVTAWPVILAMILARAWDVKNDFRGARVANQREHFDEPDSAG